jgi:4a-hydroxytetrahydrobiopterin dehydratase
MKTFTDTEVLDHLLRKFNKWSFENGVIKRDFKFKNFVEAFSFMTAVALEAEKLNHHPDWSNSYHKVSVSLITHDSNGITELDMALADKIDKIYQIFSAA